MKTLLQLLILIMHYSLVCSHRVGVIGGGASGIFAAIAAAASADAVDVLEASSSTLSKVRISGGGRCNVLPDTRRPVPSILEDYPRGTRELRGILQKRFSPSQAREWFEAQGVELKTEEDGRTFPVTDSSQTIIDALLSAAQGAGVEVHTRSPVQSIEKTDDGIFRVEVKDKEAGTVVEVGYDTIILATGSSPIGYRLATALGHTLVNPVPSLFTLSAKAAVSEGGLLHGLAGISVPHARVSLRKTKLSQEGPLLITHQGLSGPAALRLSAYGARALAETKYKVTLAIHWAPSLGSVEDAFDALWKMTTQYPKRQVTKACPLPSAAIPRRLWVALCDDTDKVWGEASKALVRSIATRICALEVEMTGKGTFKEEFVTAGGVELKEVDMRTMESKLYKGLFFCGELINVDGVTGGFNFLNCWGTGYIAGSSAGSDTPLSS